MIYTAEKAIVISKKIFQTKEELSEFVKEKGKEDVCEHVPYMKCIELNYDYKPLETGTGTIKWINEEGDFVCENGYHYSIDCFI